MRSLEQRILWALEVWDELPTLRLRQACRRRIWGLWWWRPSLAAIFMALQRLEQQGRVTSRWDEGSEHIPGRGGLRRRLYRRA